MTDNAGTDRIGHVHAAQRVRDALLDGRGTTGAALTAALPGPVAADLRTALAARGNDDAVRERMEELQRENHRLVTELVAIRGQSDAPLRGPDLLSEQLVDVAPDVAAACADVERRTPADDVPWWVAMHLYNALAEHVAPPAEQDPPAVPDESVPDVAVCDRCEALLPLPGPGQRLADHDDPDEDETCANGGTDGWTRENRGMRGVLTVAVRLLPDQPVFPLTRDQVIALLAEDTW